MDNTTLREAAERYLLNTYGSRRIALTRGQNVWVWDAEGREYLDFFSGIAVCNLGHCHPAVTEALKRQAETLWHVSNLYLIEPQIRLAEKLATHSFASRWFFCNSGAEANEGVIKLARRYWQVRGTPKSGIITAMNSFHGRTLATLTATGQTKYQAGFEPLLPGVRYVPYGDAAALDAAITPDSGLVLLEPIQGEGGVRVPPAGYLAAVREICDRRGVLLAFDEVQTGMGRTGRLFAHQHEAVTPDIISLAKALGNGIPIGAVGCAEHVAEGFAPGTHATTFGGNPLATAAGLAVVETLTAPGFLESVREKGEYFKAALTEAAGRHEKIIEVRGRGLMIGVECAEPVAPVVAAMADHGVLCGSAGPNVLRFLPPLIAEPEHFARAVETLDRVLKEMDW